MLRQFHLFEGAFFPKLFRNTKIKKTERIFEEEIVRNHNGLKSFFVSIYLMNAIRTVFKFLSCYFKLKLSWINSSYAQVILICEVIF